MGVARFKAVDYYEADRRLERYLREKLLGYYITAGRRDGWIKREHIHYLCRRDLGYEIEYPIDAALARLVRDGRLAQRGAEFRSSTDHDDRERLRRSTGHIR